MLTGPTGGGLNNVVQSFEQAGLAHLMNSWVGTGQNLPATPAQLQQGIGQVQIANLAQKMGMDVSTLMPLLVKALPLIIDKLTPQGKLPPSTPAGSNDLISQALNMFGK